MSSSTTAIAPSIDDLLSCADALFDVPDREIHLPYHAVVAQVNDEESQSVGSFGSTSEPEDKYSDHRGVKYSVNGKISDDIKSKFTSGQPNCLWQVTLTPRSEDARSKEEKAFFNAAGNQEILFTPAVSEGWKGSEAFAALTMADFQPVEDGYVTDHREDNAGLEEDDTEGREATDEDFYDPYQTGYNSTAKTAEIAGRWGVSGGTEECDGAANLHARVSVLGPSVPFDQSTSGSNLVKRPMTDSESPKTKPEAKVRKVDEDGSDSDVELPEVGRTNLFHGW